MHVAGPTDPSYLGMGSSGMFGDAGVTRLGDLPCHAGNTHDR